MAFESFRGTPVGRMATGVGGVTRSYMGTSIHRAGVTGAKDMLGISRGMGKFGRAFGLAYAGYAAYQGYQEGGLTGAAIGVGKTAAEGYVFGAALKALGGAARFGLPVLAGAAIVGGGLYGRAKAAEIGKERYRRHTQVEMGTPVLDPFGSVATMRQRSLRALNNSRLNGMTALGNEASLMYRPYSR